MIIKTSFLCLVIMVDPDDYSSLFRVVIAWKSSDCVSGVLKCANNCFYIAIIILMGKCVALELCSITRNCPAYVKVLFVPVYLK